MREEGLFRRWIFFPVEVKVRELLPKLLLTYFAIKLGFGVFIGRNGMNLSRDRFPRGIYFDKCLSTHKLDFHETQVTVLGNALVSFDEEGLLFPSEREYADSRFTQRALDLSSRVFLWGAAQRKVVSENYRVDLESEKLVVLGAPRLDTWTYDFVKLSKGEIRNIKDEFGNFILIVSNWGYWQGDKDSGFAPDQVCPRYPLTAIRASFLKLITAISEAFPETTVVVRPHPQESSDYWDQKAKDFPRNVNVISRGPIGPWVHSAQVVIHNNCTTGLEAWAGGVTTIAYSPEVEGELDYQSYTMPINQLGMICHSEDEVLRAISGSFEGVPLTPDSRAQDVIEKFLFIKDDEMAAARIVQNLVKLGVAPQPYEVSAYGLIKKMRTMVAQVKWRLKDLLGLSGMYTYKYTQQKNPGIEIWEIKELLGWLAAHFGESLDFFEVRQVDKDTFCIYGKEPDPSA